jgi:hypothetical protein
MTEVKTEIQPTEAPKVEAKDVVADVKQETVAAPQVAEEAPQKDKEEESFSRKFSALAKRERELVELEQKLKSKESSYSSVEELKKLAKRDPSKFLEQTGLTYEELTEFYLNGGVPKDSKVYEVEEKVAEIEKRLKQKEEAIANKERESAVKEYKLQQKNHIMQASDKYELIATTNSFDLVYDVTKEYYEKNNKILTHDEAAAMVENYLEKEIEKVIKSNKIRNKFATSDKKIESQFKNDSGKETIKTLTNTMASGVNPSTARPLTREESLERAASMIKWK